MTSRRATFRCSVQPRDPGAGRRHAPAGPREPVALAVADDLLPVLASPPQSSTSSVLALLVVVGHHGHDRHHREQAAPRRPAPDEHHARRPRLGHDAHAGAGRDVNRLAGHAHPRPRVTSSSSYRAVALSSPTTPGPVISLPQAQAAGGVTHAAAGRGRLPLGADRHSARRRRLHAAAGRAAFRRRRATATAPPEGCRDGGPVKASAPRGGYRLSGLHWECLNQGCTTQPDQ